MLLLRQTERVDVAVYRGGVDAPAGDRDWRLVRPGQDERRERLASVAALHRWPLKYPSLTSTTFIRLLGIFVLLGGAASAASLDTDICPVHGIKMEDKVMRLVYGMPSQAEFEKMKVAKTKFPHGKDCVLAGCVVKPAKTVTGYVCPKCVAARDAWLPARKG